MEFSGSCNTKNVEAAVITSTPKARDVQPHRGMMCCSAITTGDRPGGALQTYHSSMRRFVGESADIRSSPAHVSYKTIIISYDGKYYLEGQTGNRFRTLSCCSRAEPALCRSAMMNSRAPRCQSLPVPCCRGHSTAEPRPPVSRQHPEAAEKILRAHRPLLPPSVSAGNRHVDSLLKLTGANGGPGERARTPQTPGKLCWSSRSSAGAPVACIRREGSCGLLLGLLLLRRGPLPPPAGAS